MFSSTLVNSLNKYLISPLFFVVEKIFLIESSRSSHLFFLQIKNLFTFEVVISFSFKLKKNN